MKYELWIPGPLPSMNELIDAAKGNGGRGIGYARIKRAWTDTVCLLAKAAHIPPMRRVRLHCIWHERNKRRDPDNIVGAGLKVVCDGLVAAGVLPGDGWDHIVAFVDEWRVSKTPGVFVEIESVGALQ